MPPLPLTPLLGRERELEETSRLLETTRLLTITGAGGSGKTRLALELSHRLGDRFDGRVYWVDLQSIAEPALVEEQILDALSIRDAPAMGAMQLIVDQLRGDKALLVFDNCEHVIHAAAVAAEAILRGCSRATILTTTREALGIAGEQTWLVPPLSVQDATQLFVERARAVAPSFAIDAQNADAVARICTRLDGIPLAIELAAARVKVLTVEQILERLSDAFRLLSSGSRTLPRHRTIRETIDWSYRLLSPDEQELLRLLAVFAGTFTLEAAEAVCGCDDVLTHLSALVDKSLVLFDTRYRLLETVRQFAAEKLAQSGELDAMRERHARYFLEMVEAAEPRIFAGTIDAPTLARIDEEIGNVRAAFDWAEEDTSRAEVELRLLYALHWYWFARGHFHEARRHAEEALKRAQHVDPVIHARAQIAFGDIAVWQADWNAIRAPLEEAVSTLRGTSDLSVLSVALTLLGTAYAFADKDDYLAAKTLAEAKEMGKRHGRGLGLACYWSGVAAQLRGDWSVARAELEQCRAIGEQRGVPPAIAHANTVLGFVALHERKRDEAIDCFRRALDIHARVDDRWGLTQVIEGVGLLLLEDGAAEIGTRLLAAASAAWLNLGARPGRDVEFERQKDARIRRALGDDRLRIIFAFGAALWPGVDASRVRNNFHVTLHRLRKMLGGAEWISIENETYRIDRKNVDFDVETFVAEARAAIRSGNAAHLTRAAAIYRGDFMESTSGEGWYEDVRDRLRELYGEVLAALARVSSDPVDALERLFALNPTNEENARNLMKALEKQGERGRAQRVYKRLTSALAAIGEEPAL